MDILINREKFLDILSQIPKNHKNYLSSDFVTEKSYSLAEKLNLLGEPKWGLIIGFYLAGQIPDTELGKVISDELEVDEKLGHTYADAIIKEFDADRDKNREQNQQSKEKGSDLSAELLHMAGTQNQSEVNAAPAKKPLDAEIMSHFGKQNEQKSTTPPQNLPTNEPVQQISQETAPSSQIREQHTTTPIETPVHVPTQTPSVQHSEPHVQTTKPETPPAPPQYTYTPHHIPRFGSVMPSSHGEVPDNIQEQRIEHETPPDEHVPFIKPAPAPKPESNAPIQNPETKPAPEVEDANKKEVQSYAHRGQDPYREPIE